jgi:hypothetical protein
MAAVPGMTAVPVLAVLGAPRMTHAVRVIASRLEVVLLLGHVEPPAVERPVVRRRLYKHSTPQGYSASRNWSVSEEISGL